MADWLDRAPPGGHGSDADALPRAGLSADRRREAGFPRLLRAAFVPVLLLALVPFGATGPFAYAVATLSIAVWCGLVFLLCRRPTMPVVSALLVALVLGGWGLVQAMPDPPVISPHPVWQEAADALGRDLPASVSVAPGRTLAAVPGLVAPILLFASALLLHRTDRQAIRLLGVLATIGTCAAAFGIAQHFVSPDMLLWAEKRAYRDSLTAVFANRNTAATFLGCTVLLLMGLAARQLSGRPPLPALWVLTIEPGRARREWRLVMAVLSLFVVILALFLTKSRAGVASTLIAAGVLALVLRAPRPRRSRRRLRRRWAGRLGTAALALGALGGALVVFGGQTLRRISVSGFDDDRFCVLPGIWRAAREAWPNGTGAGTFDLVFPAYRDPACGIYWVWDKAHNVFLEGLVTLGAAFPAACALAYGALVLALLRGMRERRRERFAPAVGLAVLLLLTLHDLVDFSVQIPGMAVFAAAILAGTVAVASRGGRASRSPQSS